MAQKQTLSAPWLTVTANVEAPSDNGFTPAGPWMDAARLKAGRCRVRLRNRTGSIELVPAVEFADTPRDTSTDVVHLATAFISSVGTTDPTGFTTLSTTSDGRQLFRVGWVTRNTSGSGTSLSTCEVEGAFELQLFDGDPALVAPWMTVLCNSSTTRTFFPATPWVDAITAQSVRARLEVRALNGNITIQPAWQLANDPTSPDTAVTFGASVSANSVKFPTAWSNPSVGGKQLIRFGWSTLLSSGTSPSWARVSGAFQRLAE